MGKGVWVCGKSEIIYLSLHCHHKKMTPAYLRWAAMRAILVCFINCEGQSHKTVSIDHNF